MYFLPFNYKIITHESVVIVGSVIQATGSVHFEEGLWIDKQLKGQNDLQRVCTIPGILPGAAVQGVPKPASKFQT